jgi:hypothetical protein
MAIMNPLQKCFSQFHQIGTDGSLYMHSHDRTVVFDNFDSGFGGKRGAGAGNSMNVEEETPDVFFSGSLALTMCFFNAV